MNTKTYLGSVATMTLALGAVPTHVRINNLATGLSVFEWNVGMLANPAMAGGVITQYATGTASMVAQTAAQGLVRYFGGDIVTSSTSSQVVDPSINSTLNVSYAAAGQTFTMDTAANCTGHFSAALSSGYGVGSLITLAWTDSQGIMRSYTGRITALTSTGLSSDYVTLSLDCPDVGKNARIVWVGPQYDMVNAPVGMILPAGVKLINTTYLTSAVMYNIEWH